MPILHVTSCLQVHCKFLTVYNSNFLLFLSLQEQHPLKFNGIEDIDRMAIDMAFLPNKKFIKIQQFVDSVELIYDNVVIRIICVLPETLYICKVCMRMIMG